MAPVLTRRCLECHNASQVEGGLDLSSAETLGHGGKSGSPIEAGKADDSYLIYRVREREMPPPGKGTPLSADEVAALARWIDAGANWPAGRVLSETERTTDRRAGRDWWSWQPVVRPPLPKSSLKSSSSAVRSPVDAFIVERLSHEQLGPSPEAPRNVLVRRLYFALTGLPPTPEDIAEFLADPAPDAVERLVDRLLASPRYGERWARHWLDVVRFGETNGYETNTPRDNAWPYRDYVIRAWNDDVPYDRFIREQLAGDQLGVGVATGFIVGGPKDVVGINNLEGMRQQRFDDLDDMVSTTGSAFLGLTLNCTKCHNHKFDPVTQVDYFRMQAVFAGVQHGDRAVESFDYQRRLHLLPGVQTQLAQVKSRLGELDRAIDELGEPLANVPSGKRDGASTTGPQRTAVSALYNVDRFAPVTARFVRFTIAATHLYEPCLDELEIFTAGPAPRNVALASTGAKATASGVYDNGAQPIHQLRHVHDGKYGNSWSWISNERDRGWVQIEFPTPQTIDRVVWARDREGRFNDRLATSYQIEVATEPGAWQVVATHRDRPAFDPTKPPRRGRSPDRLPVEQQREYRELVATQTSLEQQLPRPTMTSYAGNFAAPTETRRLHRGDVMQPKETLPPGAIAGLGDAWNGAANLADAERRKSLADWIAHPEHPLTARVLVNRLWHYHFGQGLVTTPSNFGFLGGRPSHPELLDWLAAELVAGDWSIKRLHRAIVLSATYRQTSDAAAEGLSRDAGGRLWWRYPPRRLEAEPIRDAMLAVAGTLDLRQGGPGYSVFEPNDNYVRVYHPKQEFGPAEWRRMIYQTKQRMQHDATFGQFDCPDSAAVTPARGLSTTALQALNLLNSRFVTQQAEQFARRLTREAPGSSTAQVERAFQLAFGRGPTPAEQTAAVGLVAQHQLPALCRALFNATEFLYVP